MFYDVGSYRLVNFPMDKETNRNLGYCFVKVDNNTTLYTLYKAVLFSIKILSSCMIKLGLALSVTKDAISALQYTL